MQNKKLVEGDSAPHSFVLVAGEASGDNLGAPLMAALKVQNPGAKFFGIGGANMVGEGLVSWVDIEQLSVNGFIEPLKRLPSLLKILLSTRDKILRLNPVCFISIDFNFFNLLLAGMLKKKGIKTVHYVSPTIWAWRRGRIKSIAKKVDLMLTLYPFELDIYKQNNIQAVFVGHPKADEIALKQSAEIKATARGEFDLLNSDEVIALLPGSRQSEVALTGFDFFAAAEELLMSKPNLKFILPAANERRKIQLQLMLEKNFSNLPIKIVLGHALKVMQSADVVLVNSGTATLEAMLLKKPMVMSYRLGSLTYALVSRLVKTKYFALPNILSNRELVPELIQDNATSDRLAAAVIVLLDKNDNVELVREFDVIHQQLKQNSGRIAADAIATLIDERE